MESQANEKDHIKAYQEACNMIRHYSNMSFTVRTLVIAQGLILIGVWIAKSPEESYKMLGLLSGTGLLLTGFLFFFYRAYYKASRHFYDVVSRMETILFDEPFRPIDSYNQVHNKRYKKGIARWGILYAPFTLAGLIFLVALLLSIFHSCLL